MVQQRREVDSDIVQALKGSSASRSLGQLKVELTLVQAACSLSLERNRATATEITDRAVRDSGIDVTPSITGQVFSGLGIATVTSHGKSRFVLDNENLEEIRQELAETHQDLAARLESSLEAFKALPARIETLEAEWRETLRMRARERELVLLINDARKSPSRLPYLEAEAMNIREEAARTEALRDECRELSRKVKSLPSVEQKKKALEESIAAHEAEVRKLAAQEQDIAGKEAALRERIVRLQTRFGWLTLATLEQSIEATQIKLDQMSKELGEKRSLLERLKLRRESR